MLNSLYMEAEHPISIAMSCESEMGDIPYSIKNNHCQCLRLMLLHLVNDANPLIFQCGEHFVSVVVVPGYLNFLGH